MKEEYYINNIPSDSVRRLKAFANSRGFQEEFKAIFAAESINQFVSKLSTLVSKIDATDYELGKSIGECNNKIKGDMFEIFTLFFLNAFGGDRSFLIHNLRWASRDQIGYDFIGTNKKNTPVSIQSNEIVG